MALIDESSRRRPDARPDVPVALGDGQTWHLPRPRLQLRPAIVDGRFVARPDHNLGPQYLDLVEAYYRSVADESGSIEDLAVAYLSLASALLLRNYDLTADEVASLLYFDYGLPADEANRETVEAVTSIALGRDSKKTSPATPSPT